MISQALRCKPHLIIVHPNTHRRKMCHYIVPPRSEAHASFIGGKSDERQLAQSCLHSVNILPR